MVSYLSLSFTVTFQLLLCSVSIANIIMYLFMLCLTKCLFVLWFQDTGIFNVSFNTYVFMTAPTCNGGGGPTTMRTDEAGPGRAPELKEIRSQEFVWTDSTVAAEKETLAKILHFRRTQGNECGSFQINAQLKSTAPGRPGEPPFEIMLEDFKIMLVSSQFQEAGQMTPSFSGPPKRALRSFKT